MASPKLNMPETVDPLLRETLSRQQAEIDRMKDALALLGVAQCSWCKKYYRRSEPGAMFDGGELVCYGCIPQWWPQRREQLSGKDRDDVEGKLVFWLRQFHKAESFKDPDKLPESSQQELSLEAKCLECRGTGTSGGDERCRFCEGRGLVWIVVPKH